MGLSTFDLFKNLKDSQFKVLSSDDIWNIQKELFDMLIDFDDFCKQYEIEYELGGGSALGIIRHQGFIPWDDDIDLNITRDNYQKLKKHFEGSALSQKYWFHNPTDTPNFDLAFARLRKKGTIYKTRDDIFRDNECGICIDLFIIENTYDNSFLRKFHGYLSLAVGFLYSCRRFHYYQSFYKTLKIDKKVYIIKNSLGFLLSFMSMNKWTKLWDKVNGMCHNNQSRYVVVPTGRKHFFGELYPREILCQYQRRKFIYDNKTILLPSVKDSDRYLKGLYGDYMKLPNTDEIETHIVFDLKFNLEEGDI